LHLTFAVAIFKNKFSKEESGIFTSSNILRTSSFLNLIIFHEIEIRLIWENLNNHKLLPIYVYNILLSIFEQIADAQQGKAEEDLIND
jgi:hypothetical protein